MPVFTKDEMRRYSRHLILPEFGEKSQHLLKSSKILCIGAGGLGSPAATYLAASGVGTLGIVDSDVVDISNLHRQILHSTAEVGLPKVDSAKKRLKAINPHVNIKSYNLNLDETNALNLFRDYDVILDGSDNYVTRYLISDACVLLKKPNVSASVFQFEGQLSTFCTQDGPCYRCLFPEPPPESMVPVCGEGGIFSVAPGILGCLQAADTIKLITGVGEPLINRLLMVDILEGKFRTLKIQKDPKCPVCGTNPSIKELVKLYPFTPHSEQKGRTSSVL